MTYEFQSRLFKTSREAADAIVEEWITASGSNDAAYTASYLSENNSDSIVSEIVYSWELDEIVSTGRFDDDGNNITETWLESRDLDHGSLVEAVDRFRNRGVDA